VTYQARQIQSGYGINWTVDVYIETTGMQGKTGLVYNTAGLKCYYRRPPTGSATAVTLATQTVGGAYSSGGFVEIDATNMPGLYRFDVPSAAFAFASGVYEVSIEFSGIASTSPVILNVQLTGIDPFDSLRGGLTALPNAVAEAAGGLYTRGSGTGQITHVNAAQVKTEVVNALNVDTYAEPGQNAPASTISLAAKINYLYKAWRNLSTQTASEYALYADNDTTKDQKAAVSDNGTTFDRGKIVTGP